MARNNKAKKRRMERSKQSSGNYPWHKGPTKRWQMMRKLTPPDWSQLNLEKVKKNFYQEHPNVKARDEATIKEYMVQSRMAARGSGCPRPVQAFDEFSFSDGIMGAIKAQNFVKPTPIQSQAIPVALSGRDMVGIADTGSGKTLAFILPAITHILENNRPRNVGEPEVVVLAPTRELAQQIHQVVIGLGPGIGVTSECFYGGSRRAEQATLTEKVFEICIATPGRMVDFLGEGWVKLHKCAFFVLDEADRMLDMGFEPQISQVIGQSRPDRQMLMFSATWPPEIQGLAEKYLKDYILVNIGSLQISANHNITQKLEFCEDITKPQRIVKIMTDVMKQEENKTLIFVNSKLDVDVLTLRFRSNGWPAMGLHGGKKQPEREKVFNDFKVGNLSILIATDVAARGLDVDDIKYIINYDYPFSSEDYVHRIGRTGRCDRKGIAITFFTQRDRDGAKDLIAVLEEAGQEVPPNLRHMSQLPRLTKNEKRNKPHGSKMKKKHLKKIVMRGDVNNIPLGSHTNSNSLPDLDDLLDPSLVERVTSITTGNKRKNKSKFQLVLNSENKVQVALPPPPKKAKTGLRSDDCTGQPSKFTNDCYSDSFENPQWAPDKKSEENTGNVLGKNSSNNADLPVTNNMNLQRSNLRMNDREIGQKYEVSSSNAPSSADVRKVYYTENQDISMPGNSRNYASTNNRSAAMPGNSRSYETSTDNRNVSMYGNSRSYETSTDDRNKTMPGNYGTSTDYRNINMYGNSRNYESSTDNRNISMPGNSRNYGTSTDTRNMSMYGNSRNYEASTDNRNISMPGNSRNYETYVDSRNMGPSNESNMRMTEGSSVSDRNIRTRMGPVNTKMPVSSGNMGMHTDSRNVHPSSSVQNRSGVSLDQRQNMGWRSQSYNNYMDHQAPNQGPYRSNNNYNMNRMNMNDYSGRNWSGGSGYSQY